MKADPYVIGRMVISTQGHDKGRCFLVVQIVDDRYVIIADGQTRKMAHPKKKQLKHLRTVPYASPEAVSMAQVGAGTADSAIRKVIKAYTDQQLQGSLGADRNINKEECALVQK